MFNRYVDGLDTWQPADRAAYREMGRRMASVGYVRQDRDDTVEASVTDSGGGVGSRKTSSLGCNTVDRGANGRLGR